MGGSRKSSGRSRTFNPHPTDVVEEKLFRNAPIFGSSVRIHRRYRAYQRLPRFRVRAFPFAKLRVVCPLLTSAYLTRDVAIQGAAGLLMRRCLFCGSLMDSSPSTAQGDAGFLVIRMNPFRNWLMSPLPHGKQISPDKDVNFPCTTAAFTLPPSNLRALLCCANSPRG